MCYDHRASYDTRNQSISSVVLDCVYCCHCVRHAAESQLGRGPGHTTVCVYSKIAALCQHHSSCNTKVNIALTLKAQCSYWLFRHAHMLADCRIPGPVLSRPLKMIK